MPVHRTGRHGGFPIVKAERELCRLRALRLTAPLRHDDVARWPSSCEYKVDLPSFETDTPISPRSGNTSVRSRIERTFPECRLYARIAAETVSSERSMNTTVFPVTAQLLD